MESRHQRSLSLAAVLALAVAATITADVDRDAVPERVEARAELRAISARLDGARSQVLIEASEPVAYVTSQPDPLTVVVDLRNVSAGVMPPGLGPLPPVSDVQVEDAVAGDGAEVARVKIKLAYPAKHRVRSSRNMIYVEVDRGVVPHEPGTVPGAVPGLKPGPAASESPEGKSAGASGKSAGLGAESAGPERKSAGPGFSRGNRGCRSNGRCRGNNRHRRERSRRNGRRENRQTVGRAARHL